MIFSYLYKFWFLGNTIIRKEREVQDIMAEKNSKKNNNKNNSNNQKGNNNNNENK